METLERERIRTVNSEHEQARSFDLLSSVNLIRHDLEELGYVREETEQRIYDEELTLIAEGIDRFSYTSFTLQEQEGRLVFFDRGEWRPYVGTLLTGLNVAKSEAQEDHRRGFLADWAARDLEIGYKLEELQPGEAVSWDNPFPEDMQKLYGDTFLTEVGLQPKRKMGFIYRAERNMDGSVTLETHSIDNSNEQVFEAARDARNRDPRASIDEQVGAVDGWLGMKYGEEFFAGRKLSNCESKENAWSFLEKNKPLINYYMGEIRALAESSLTGERLYKTKKALTIGVWARTKELLNEQTYGVQGHDSNIPHSYRNEQEHIGMQVQQALHNAILRQDVMVGCGGSVSTKELMDMTPEEAFDAIFGESKEKPESGGEMRCVSCPECKTFHERVRKVKGKPVCDNQDCKLHG